MNNKNKVMIYIHLYKLISCKPVLVFAIVNALIPIYIYISIDWYHGSRLLLKAKETKLRQKQRTDFLLIANDIERKTFTDR